MYPDATLKRTIPMLEKPAPFRWGLGFLLLFTLVVVGRIHEIFPAVASLRVGLITGGLAALAWILAPGSFQEKVPTRLRPVRYLLILTALAVCTIPIGVYPRQSFDFLTDKYSKIVLMFLLVIYWCRSIQDVRRMMWVCCLGAVALVVAGMLTGQLNSDQLVSDQLVSGDKLVADRFSAGSKSYDPNDLALLLIMLLPFLFYLFSTSRGVLSIVVLGFAMVCLYGIVLTQSRAGLLTLLSVGALTMWRSTLSGKSKVMIVLIAALVFGVLAGSTYWERMGTIWNPRDEVDSTAAGRTDVWKTGLIIMATHPLGVGISGFETAEGLSHGGFGKWSAAHNSFLQIGVELGVPGLIVFLLWITHTIKALRRIQKRPPMPVTALKIQKEPGRALNPLAPLAAALEISLCGFVVGGFFLSAAYGGLLYVLLALSLACSRLAADPELSQPEQVPKLWKAFPQRKPLLGEGGGINK